MPTQVAAADKDDGRAIALLDLDDSAKTRLLGGSLTLFSIIRSVYTVVFEPHLPLWKATLARPRQVHSLDAPNHETGTTSSPIW